MSETKTLKARMRINLIFNFYFFILKFLKTTTFMRRSRKECHFAIAYSEANKETIYYLFASHILNQETSAR